MEERLVIEVVGVIVGKGVGKGLLIEESRVEHRFFAEGGLGQTECNLFGDVTVFLSVAPVVSDK